MLEKIKKHQIYIRLYQFLDQFKFQSGVSLLFIIKTFFNKMKEDDLQTMAGSIAFNFTMSLFPGLIFLFTLLPYFHLADLTTKIQELMMQELPKSIYDMTWTTVDHILNKKNGSLLSIGFLSAIWLSKNSMLSLMSAFNKVYSTKDSRGFIKKQAMAVMLTSLFVFCIFSAVVVLVFGNQIVYQIFEFLELGHESFAEFLISMLRYLVIFLMFLMIISIIYYFAPTVKRKFRFFSAGSFFATILILLVAKIFSFYVDNFGNYNKLYGSIGAILGLMFFFYAISLIILVGFQVNASIDKARSEFLSE